MKKHLFLLFLFITCNLFSENVKKNSFYIQRTEGEIIYSLSDGNISAVGFDAEKGFFITVDYDTIGIKVTYCNLKSTYILKGQLIKKGERIASVGYTGNVSEPGINLIIEIDENNFLFQKESDNQ